MNIVVLMSGLGKRFVRAGYMRPKPLIRVGGKMLIEHVLDQYPGRHKFWFVCNEEHTQNTDILNCLRKLVPDCIIKTIKTHKMGAVHALSSMWDLLPSDEPVMVSYCDFGANWDFKKFTHTVSSGEWDAAVPCYAGFHPHLLRGNKYAGVLAEIGGKMLAIKEKHCFTENPMYSYHSAGNYYFLKASEMMRYAKKLLRNGEAMNGEYYVSMLYYSYLSDSKKVLVYPMKHFLQLGTPEDLEEYAAWFKLVNKDSNSLDNLIDIPDSRKTNARVPYKARTVEFRMCLDYWRSYFNKMS